LGIDGDKKGWDASHPQIGDKMGMGIGMEKSARDASLYKPALKGVGVADLPLPRSFPAKLAEVIFQKHL
jgi:hypothetical protein